MSAVYDSDKDVFFVRTWRCAGEAIATNLRTNIDSANSIFHQNDVIVKKSKEEPNWLFKNKNIAEGSSANLGYLTSIDELVGTKWENSWKFAVIRNPYSVVYSEWKSVNTFFTRIVNMHGLEKMEQIIVGRLDMPIETVQLISMDFNEYVKYKFQTAKKFKDVIGVNRFGIAGSLYHANGDIGVDEVLYYEDLDSEWTTKVATPKGYTNRFTTFINYFPIDQIVGTFQNVDWPDAYNEESKALVANFYRADLEIFGYTFEDGNNKPSGHIIPTNVSVEPFGPWGGLSTPGRRFASFNSPFDDNDCVDEIFRNRAEMGEKQAKIQH